VGQQYSLELRRLDPAWKSGLDIPRRGTGTAVVLQVRLRGLWRALGRTEPEGCASWTTDRLYAEWFERAAEYLLRKEAPETWALLRRRETETVPERRAGQARVQGALF
jgi:hypothetical protein